MLNGRRILALIPARGGSKRLPDKNIRPLAGKPLIAWTIIAANQANCIDRIIVSTDDEIIAETAADFGAEVPFLRPPELADDTATSVDMALHALTSLDSVFDFLLLLQPTSPLRTAKDIEGIVRFSESAGANSCISVSEALIPLGYFFTLSPEKRLRRVVSPDKYPDRPIYNPNGAAFLVHVPWFLEHRTFYHEETLAYVMPQHRSVDIDTEMDFFIAEASMLKHGTSDNSMDSI